MYGWIKEFSRDYEVPSEITDRFDDWSWHNDTSPSFLIMEENPVKHETDEDGTVTILPQEDIP